jgi:uncharacterized membrane protein YgcG
MIEGKRGSRHGHYMRGVIRAFPALDVCSPFLSNISTIKQLYICFQSYAKAFRYQSTTNMTKDSSSSSSGSGSGSGSSAGAGASSGASEYTVTNRGTNDQVGSSEK